VDTSAPFYYLQMGFTSISGRGYETTVTVVTKVQTLEQNPPSQWSASVQLRLRETATISGCTPPRCSASTTMSGAGILNQLKAPETDIDLSLNKGQVQGAMGSLYWTDQATFAVYADNLAYAQNGSELEAQLPSVTLASQPSRAGPEGQGGPVIQFQYALPGSSSWDWIGGPQPALVDAQANSVSWSEALSAASQHAQISAANRSNQAQDALFTFFAGALVAVAGGAWVAALQEFLHMHYA
jgi:hypothetical protein